MIGVDGSVALVTGGASGLGAATTRELRSRGFTVVALDLPAAIDKAPPTQGVTFAAADVTDEQQVRAAVELAMAMGQLRVTVNCAGIAPGAHVLGRSGPHDLDLFRKVIEINLIGTFVVVSFAAAAMAHTEPDVDGQRGVIINTASIAAFEGQMGQAAYAASKAGVAGLTLPLARDLASSGIRVCTIAPGMVDTPMLAAVSDKYRASLTAAVPFPQRMCRPDEYARLVSMIVEHDYLNGETIRMDGALRLAPQ